MWLSDNYSYCYEDSVFHWCLGRDSAYYYRKIEVEFTVLAVQYLMDQFADITSYCRRTGQAGSIDTYQIN
jgi:hypothetical protein